MTMEEMSKIVAFLKNKLPDADLNDLQELLNGGDDKDKPAKDKPAKDKSSFRLRGGRGADKLAAQTKKICSTVDGIIATLERAAQSASILRAHDKIMNSPETKAVRDRAAFDQAWADRNDRQRQQIAETQDKARKFYRRAA